MPQIDPLEKLVTWGESHPSIRAMILTSTRARPSGKVDRFSDYDLIMAVTDAEHFDRDRSWVLAYGQPMVRWGDQNQIYGLITYFQGVIYTDHVRVDYTVWPIELLDRISAAETLLDELDAGYQVLFDKDHQTTGWKAPSYRAYIPTKPTAEEYQALVEEFWWGTTYVAKSLWRNEVIFVKWCLDVDLKIITTRKMLEWLIEIDQDWSWKPGVLGRGLERWLTPDTLEEFDKTYTGTGIAENWDALFRSIALFRRVAQEVANALGYAYPQLVDDQVSAYIEEIRQLPPPNPENT
jgi:aminoglycoside 6-adenylyltransferase